MKTREGRGPPQKSDRKGYDRRDVCLELNRQGWEKGNRSQVARTGEKQRWGMRDAWGGRVFCQGCVGGAVFRLSVFCGCRCFCWRFGIYKRGAGSFLRLLNSRNN